MTDSNFSVQDCLDRHKAGDIGARAQLVEWAYPPLERIAARRYRSFLRLKGWVPVEDVVEDAAIKLWRVLERIAPATPADLLRLLGVQVRRVLIESTRRHCGPHGLVTRTEKRDGALDSACDRDRDPEALARWTAFHEAIAALPQRERAIARLVWYGQLTLVAAGALVGVSADVAERRWHDARDLLCGASVGRAPDR